MAIVWKDRFACEIVPKNVAKKNICSTKIIRSYLLKNETKSIKQQMMVKIIEDKIIIANEIEV